jgi:hypothetical protein
MRGNQAEMPQASDTYRLAIGVFHEPSGLRSAVAELADHGFSAEETCLAGKRHVLESALPERLGDGAVALQSLSLPGHTPTPGLVATSGSTLEMVLQESRSTDATASFWPDLCRSLGEHMERGGIVLCVSAGDAALQARSSRILLRHSTQSVQTFEFTPAKTASGHKPAREAP